MTRLSTILRQQLRRPFDATEFSNSDRVSLTPAGEAALDAARAADKTGDGLPAGCPRCGALLGSVNLYHGGRGYVSYDVCTNTLCGYRRRA